MEYANNVLIMSAVFKSGERRDGGASLLSPDDAREWKPERHTERQFDLFCSSQVSTVGRRLADLLLD